METENEWTYKNVCVQAIVYKCPEWRECLRNVCNVKMWYSDFGCL